MSKDKPMGEILGDIRNSSEKERTIREFLKVPEIDVDKISGAPVDPLQEKSRAIREFAKSLGVNILMAIMDPKTKQSAIAGAAPFDVEGMNARDVAIHLLCGNIESLASRDPFVYFSVIRTIRRIAYPDYNED